MIGALKFAASIGAPVFKWFATHVMPWAAMFLAGFVYADNRAEIKTLRADVRELEAEKAAAAATIEADGRIAAKAADDERAAQTALLNERERFYATLTKLRAPVTVLDGACPADAGDAARMLHKVEAAYRFALGAMPGGPDGAAGADERPGRDAAPPD